jgi:homoserine acetyltransferase
MLTWASLAMSHSASDESTQRIFPTEEISMKDYEIFQAGDVVLQNGSVLAGATLAYATYGKLNETRDNVIVYPTFFCGNPADNEWLIG